MQIKFYCHKLFVELNLRSLDKYFEPLATYSSLPVLAGDTLYPTINHHIAAQLFRDINRLESANVVPEILEIKDLRAYIRNVTQSCDAEILTEWREQKMYNSLKVATLLKFSQYPELKALLMQTGNCLLVENHSEDVDWAIGFSREKLENWMQVEHVSLCDILFWTMHPEFRPNILGANMNGRLLMNMRQEFLTESGLDFKPSSFSSSDTVSCKACQLSIEIDSTKLAFDDEIININTPGNQIAHDFPSVIHSDGQFFHNVDHFVREQCRSRRINDKSDASLADSNRKLEFLASCYEKALKLAYEQNALLREVLLSTGNAILVEIRPKGDDVFAADVPSVATYLGAFDGSFDEFRAYFEKNRISPKSLSIWWQFSQKLKHEIGPSYVLKNIGDNLIGQALMKIRAKIASGSFPTNQSQSIDQIMSDFGPQRITTLVNDLSDSESENYRPLFKIHNLLLCDEFEFLPQSDSDGPANPLSRHYLSPFTLNNIRFLSVEHCYWWSKMSQLAPKSFTDRLLRLPANQLSGACNHWLASNTPLCDEEAELSGAALESQVLIDATYAKLNQNPSILRFLVKDLKILVHCTASQFADFKRQMTEHSLNGKLMLYLWLGKLNSQPHWLCDNMYGLILMKIRQKFFDQYFRSYVSPLNDKLKNIEIDECGRECSSLNYFVFDDSSPIKFDRFSAFVDQNVQYQSVYHYLFSKCLENLGLPKQAEALINTVSDPFDCLKFVEVAVRLNQKYDEFQTWLFENERRIILQAFELCSQTSLNDLEGSLLQTSDAYLIYASRDKNFGIGSDRGKFVDFVRNLRLPPVSFASILSNDDLRPPLIGLNSWAKHLSWFRSSSREKQSEKDVDDTKADDTSSQTQFFSIVDNLEIEDKCEESKDAALLKPPEVVDGSQYRLLSWGELSNLIKLTDRSDDQNALLNTTSTSTTIKAKPDDASQQLDARSLAILSALDFCCESASDPTSPCVFFADLLDRCQNDQERFKLGAKLAQCFDKLFGLAPSGFKYGLEQLLIEKGGLTAEDLHNIGRIAGFESS